MKQLTIRGVDDSLHAALRNGAKRRGLSMNRFILNLIREALGLENTAPQQPAEFHDLDSLAGVWSQDEFEEFERELAAQRTNAE